MWNESPYWLKVQSRSMRRFGYQTFPDGRWGREWSSPLPPIESEPDLIGVRPGNKIVLPYRCSSHGLVQGRPDKTKSRLRRRADLGRLPDG